MFVFFSNLQSNEDLLFTVSSLLNSFALIPQSLGLSSTPLQSEALWRLGDPPQPKSSSMRCVMLAGWARLQALIGHMSHCVDLTATLRGEETNHHPLSVRSVYVPCSAYKKLNNCSSATRVVSHRFHSRALVNTQWQIGSVFAEATHECCGSLVLTDANQTEVIWLSKQVRCHV